MNKYLSIFALSWQTEFNYRFNLILWRIRHILKLLMILFLWYGIFAFNNTVFGYTRPEILTYIFLALIVSSFVTVSTSQETIGGEISSGDVSNYLVKPIDYIKYWFIRDLSGKFLNIMFAVFEVFAMWSVFKPQIEAPPSILIFAIFLLTCFLASLIAYFLGTSARFIAFWSPENTWALAFITLVLIDLLGGWTFPLDILPYWLQFLLQFTPFPYLIYFPVNIYLGKIVGLELIRIISQYSIWVGIGYFCTYYIWKKGLLTYSSEGR